MTPGGVPQAGGNMVRRIQRLVLVVSLLSAGCSTTFTPTTCTTDNDCGSGNVCEMQDGQSVCLPATAAPLKVGSIGPLTGTNSSLGTDMRLGLSLAIDAQNAAGGIRGRQIVLDYEDDGYDPVTAGMKTTAILN